MKIDPLTELVLVCLADRYRPVSSDWIETGEIASRLGIDVSEINAHCQLLTTQALIELSPPDEEHLSYAAIITNKGLLAIGRAP